jgi:hypothetical protein
MLKTAIVSVLSLALPTLAEAGPFGVDLDNFRPEAYDCEKQENSFLMVCKKFSKPHPDVEAYFIKYIPEIGVCYIKAVSKDIIDSRYGRKLQSSVDEIHNQLKGKYGDATLYDYLNAGSIWDEPEDWMMGLRKNERQYGYEQDLKSPIDGVIQFGVYANATSQDTGYWSAQFITPLASACEDAETKLKAGSF